MLKYLFAFPCMLFACADVLAQFSDADLERTAAAGEYCSNRYPTDYVAMGRCVTEYLGDIQPQSQSSQPGRNTSGQSAMRSKESVSQCVGLDRSSSTRALVLVNKCSGDIMVHFCVVGERVSGCDTTSQHFSSAIRLGGLRRGTISVGADKRIEYFACQDGDYITNNDAGNRQFGCRGY